MGVSIQTKYAIGDIVKVNREYENFLAIIDTVSFMQFRTDDGRLITDLVYIGVDESGDRRTFNESECKTN